MKKCFYVYVLFRPWDGSPCYVGKGQGDRWQHHERYGEKHYNPHLRRIIQKAAAMPREARIIGGKKAQSSITFVERSRRSLLAWETRRSNKHILSLPGTAEQLEAVS